MTLEQIRAALPTHIMLTPGVHRWRDGDICLKASGNPDYIIEVYPITIRADMKDWVGKTVTHIPRHILCGHRPIPPHILDNQAFWIWFDSYDIDRHGIVVIDFVQQKAGRLYDKWLLEQMEGI